MSNVDDRLRAADPMADRAYQHPDLDAMVTRITSPVPPRRDGQWTGFKLKMASAVAAASMITVGGIAALQAAGPSLAVLTLGAASAGAKSPTSSAMMIYEKFQFTAGADLGTAPSLGTAYEVQSPADPSSEAARIAVIFKVSGTPQNVNGDGSNWTVTDPSGSTLVYQSYFGVASWYFNSSSSIASSSVTTTPPSSAPGAPSATSSSTVPSTATLESDVAGYMKRLGYGYSLSSPSFSTSQSSTGPTPDSSSATINEETVRYTVSVEGTPTDQTAQFTVDGSNNLVDASGPAFNVTSSTNYPLQSPVEGVAALNAEQQRRFAPTHGTTVTPESGVAGPPGVAASTTTTGPGVSGGSSGPTTSTTVPQGPPIVNVLLNDVTVILGTYQLDDGTVCLVPVYSYTGVASGLDGSTYTGNWTTIAVDSAYVHFSNAGGGVIAYSASS